MTDERAEIRIKGRTTTVPSASIDGRTVITTGRWVRIANIKDEDLVEGEAFRDPRAFVAALKASGLKADVFTFAQKMPDTTPHYPYQREWDNLAVIPITTFKEWWDGRAESSVRRACRKAAKSGVTVKVADLDADFARGIVEIYDETPIRQGRSFWHYRKDAEAVRLENGTYPERSDLVGAYLGDELIGFMKIIYVDRLGSIVQVLTKKKHFDKRPSNALIAKAVELCEQRGLAHLQYCSFIYNDPNSSLTEFKRRSGFEQVLVPRYYVPLTLKGRLALSLRLHRGLAKHIPQALLVRLLKLRSRWYARRVPAAGEAF